MVVHIPSRMSTATKYPSLWASMAVIRLRPRKARGTSVPLKMDSPPQWRIWVFLIVVHHIRWLRNTLNTNMTTISGEGIDLLILSIFFFQFSIGDGQGHVYWCSPMS
ncbi:hypothetical protein Y032_0003g1592 [Ancylostoma ceylanicum]|uniref:Uncharacterized protein n=1 Tax=Ancylostoma ceylanicum TaxID=53326 RepID=A0A016VYR2_9BILA|nr:hypothetical protein Y032_0003g1592 [Ancylostoma ceylanicum]